MNTLKQKKKRMMRRRFIIKNKIRRNKNALRLCISRSLRNLYAQIIDDSKQRTVIGVSTLSKEFPPMKNRGNRAAAEALGGIVAQKAIAAGIKKVVFDRNGYLYHGKVKAFADAARKGGLEF